MRPPFRLEPYRGVHQDNKNKRVFYNILEYQPIVKNHNWQRGLESYPFDNEEAVRNCRVAHYNHLGQDICHCYATTSSDMNRQLELKADYMDEPAKKITSYFSFKDSNTCKDADMTMFPEICAGDYVTTMQRSYTTPFPMIPSNVFHKETDWLENRIMKREDRYLSKHMFWDEGLVDVIRAIQCHKSHRNKSFDFCKGVYTDGTHHPEKKRHCVQYKSLYL